MMGEWKKVKLGEIGSVITGKTPSKNNPEDWGDEMLFITPTDYGSYGKRAFKSARKLSLVGIDRFFSKILPPNSLLVTCIGSDMGKVVMNGIKAVTNQQINSIIPNSEIVNADFSYYLLVDLYETLRTYGASGTAVPIVNKGNFERIEVQIPHLSEQRAIAGVLSSLDDKIDILHRQNQTLEQMAETLFRQWFVEEADENWKEGVLGDLFILQRGFDLPKQKRCEGSYPIYASSGHSGNHSNFKVQGPGVTTGRSGVLGNVFYIDQDFWPLNTSLFVKFYKNCTPLYAYFFLKTIDLQSFNAGSAVPTLNRNHLHEYPVLIPPSNLIIKYQKLVEDSFQKIKSNQTQIRTLEKIRDTLLPKLMSGGVRIKM